jgi:hypothetical protein
MKRIPKPKECTLCGRGVVNSFICRRCGKELRDLLIGSSEEQGQPGIIWYIHRLRETAYRQAKMEQVGEYGSTSYVDEDGKACSDGYGLLMDHRAVALLHRISVLLARWNADCEALIDPQRKVNALRAVTVAGRGLAGLDEVYARRLAANIPALRHHCPDICGLHRDLLEYAKQGWKVINRPNDICCGRCPNMIPDKDPPHEENLCDAWLYAEEHAETVTCPKCRAEHDVSELREKLKHLTRDMLFTGPELLHLMATGLNDKIPKSTFYQLISDGRLQYRTINDEGAHTYTYADVCEAREKPKPVRRFKSARAV